MTAILPHRSSGTPDENLFGPVARLSTLAAELAEIPLGPRPAFRTELRARLLEEAGRPSGSGAASTELPAPRTAGRVRGGRFGHRAAAVGLALALTGGGVAAAAGHALPGEPLYPVKRLEQSVRLALDPTSGVGPTVRLLSARISETQHAAAVDPTGADSGRWNDIDSGFSDVDKRLVQLSGSVPAPELSAALAPDRARLEQLLPAVPLDHQSGARRLADTIDELSAAQPTSASGSLPVGLLPPGGITSPDALANGWPLDPAGLQLPSTLPAPDRLPNARRTPAPSTGSPSQRTSQVGTPRSGTASSAPVGSGASGGLPHLPLGSLPSGSSRSSTSSSGVLPPTTSGVGGTVAHVVGGTIGGSGGGTTTNGGGSGTVAGTVGVVVGDATDTVRRLPVINGIAGTTSTH